MDIIFNRINNQNQWIIITCQVAFTQYNYERKYLKSMAILSKPIICLVYKYIRRLFI